MARGFDLVDGFLDFYGRWERMASGVVARLLDAGFSYCLMKKGGKTVDVHALLTDDFEANKAKIARHCKAHYVEKGGWIEIRHRDRTFMRVYFHPDGTARYHFGSGDKSAAETLAEEKEFFLSIRGYAEDLLDEAFLIDAVTLISHFFQSVPAGGYRLLGFVGGQRITRGEWDGEALGIEVENVGQFLDFALVALQGTDFAKVSMKNAMDMMRFYGRMKDALAAIAGTLTAEAGRLDVNAGGLPIFSTGWGVRPSPTDAYGNTEIRIDNTLSALAASRRSG